MARKNPAAVLLGRRGGQVKSTAKTIAARANGKKGGRPAKVLKALIVLLAAWSGACGSSPTAPTPPPPPVTPPAPTTVTITGHVTATTTGVPLPGLSATLGTTTITTDGSGSFSTSMPPQASVSLALTGASIVPRTIRVAATNTRDVAVNAIQLGNGFDVGFYRQLVRDNYDAPGVLRPLRRLTTVPSIYVQTVDINGRPIGNDTIDPVIETLLQSIVEWSGGTFPRPTVVRGTETRDGFTGWQTIAWDSADTGSCATSYVAVDGATMVFRPRVPGCRCAGQPSISPSTVRHEAGHLMGFWHTDSPGDVMYPSAVDCRVTLSARERYHAAIAYQRPVGNVEPDQDPAGIVALAPLRVQ